MQNAALFEKILYNLSKASGGRSAKLFEFFSLEKEKYHVIFPLTKLQRDIYIDTLLHAENDPGIHNFGEYIEYEGEVDTVLWERALGQLVRQEPVLRTVLVKKGALLYQAQAKVVDPEFEVHDLSGRPTGAILQFINERIKAPYGELTGRPLYRMLLIKAGKCRYFLAMCCHQLAHDGGSVLSFFKKLLAIYHGTQPVDNVSVVPFFDHYIFRNNDTFDRQDTLDFWREQLENTSVLGGSPGMDVRRDGHIVKELSLSPGTYPGIEKFCREAGIGFAFYFKMLYCLLLDYYFSPDGDFIFFENRHGRSEAETDSLGLFFHPRPVKCSKEVLAEKNMDIAGLIGDFRAFRELSRDAGSISMGSFYTLKKQDGVQPIFNYLDQRSIREQGIRAINMVESRGNTSEVQLLVQQRENSFDLIFCFHSVYLDGNDFLQRLEHISGQIVANRFMKLKDLRLIMDMEEQHMASFFSLDAAVPYNVPFGQLFEKQVSEKGGSVAVRFEKHSWTYDELNEKANRLAHYLEDRYKVGRGDFVGVWMPRSHFTLVSMIALFKVGAVYLPLEPELVSERLLYILAETCPKVVIIDSSMVEQIIVDENLLFVIDWELKGLATPGHNLSRPNSASDLAYIIYTSGTTGRPKGVLVEHQGMVNHIFAKINDLQLTATTVVAQNANAGFDISIWQFLACLVTGGQTVVYPNGLIADCRAFIDQVHKDDITVLELVPAYLSLLLSSGIVKHGLFLHTLRHLLVTGEAVSVSLIRSFFAKFPGIFVVNAYGPTEASDDITHYVMEDTPEYLAVPIGKPIPNIRIYIVDKQERLCAVGVKGEIYVSGVCVGRGYLNDTATTQRAFGTDLFGHQDNVRLYRTGDIGSWLPEGNIFFHGRRDSQVKIHGHRIELGEIENSFCGLEGVGEVIAGTRKNAKGEDYLVAYLRMTRPLTPARLAGFLQSRLPAYMMPRAFIFVDEWPLTVNKKIDRKALLLLPEQYADQGILVAPENDTEATLLAMWRELLGKEHISVNANFFELGGHSLRAMQLISRIYEKFGLQVDLKLIFSHPTIRSQAEVLAGEQLRLRQNGGLLFRPISVAGEQEDYEISHAQRRLLVLSEYEEPLIAYNCFGAKLLEGFMDIFLLRKAIAVLMERHDSFRTVFLMEYGEFRQKVIRSLEAASLFETEFMDCRGESCIDTKIDVICQQYARFVFDLGKLPLIKTGLFRIEDDQYVFIYTIHHIISDGWSSKVFFSELMYIYNCLQDGMEYHLPQLKVRYRDYAAWHNRSLRDKVFLQPYKDYWTKKLWGVGGQVGLAPDYRRPGSRSYNGRVLRRVVEEELVVRIRRSCHHLGVSLFTFLLAAVKLLLFRYSREEDIVIGTSVAGRDHPDLEDQVGFYVNTLALRTTFSGKDTFEVFLNKVHATVLEGLKYQFYPFDLVVEDLVVQRDLSQSPFFNVKVVLQNTEDLLGIKNVKDTAGIKGIKISNYPVELRVSIYDLSLRFTECDTIILADMEYDTDLFTDQRIGQLFEHLLTVLRNITEDPGILLENTPYLMEAEKDTLLRRYTKGDLFQR